MRLILVFCIGLLGIAYFLLTGWYPEVKWLQSVYITSSWAVFVSVVGIGLTAAAKQIRPKDPALVSWMSLGMTGCLFLIILFPAKLQQESLDRARDFQLSDMRAQVRMQILQREQKQVAEAKAKQFVRPKDRFTQYEGRIPAVALESIRELDDTMKDAINEQVNAYQTALDENPTLGPSAWVLFKSIDELQQERLSHRRLYEATRAFTTFVQSFEETYTSAIEALQLQPPADRVAIAEMERILQSWDRNNSFAVRRLDVEVLASALNALDVLKEAWGAWSFSPRDNQLTFENPAMEARFFEAMQRLKAASDAVKKLAPQEE